LAIFPDLAPPFVYCLTVYNYFPIIFTRTINVFVIINMSDSELESSPLRSL